MEHLFFYIGLAFILTHELDAVQMKEWRIFPLISFLDDKMGYWVFTALHIPLFVMFFYGLRQNPNGTMHGLDIFLWCMLVCICCFCGTRKTFLPLSFRGF